MFNTRQIINRYQKHDQFQFLVKFQLASVEITIMLLKMDLSLSDVNVNTMLMITQSAYHIVA